MSLPVQSKNIWVPHPGPQEEVLTRSEFEILYGGARGGGKTESGLVWVIENIDNPLFRGLVVRRTADDLKDWIDRAVRMYRRYGVEKAGNPAELRFPSGAIIRTGHLGTEDAYTKYQGHEYHKILVEELTQIPRETDYEKLITSCRSTVDGLHPQVFATTNPGGVGHLWVKERFIDVAPWGMPYTYETKFEDKIIRRSRIFIHSKVEDNPSLISKDPGYILMLESLKETDEDLYYAWRWGDWERFAGQFFRNFKRRIHVIPEFAPRNNLPKVGSIDWGFNAPFCFLASCVESTKTPGGINFQRTWTYDEMYESGITPADWGKKIYDRYDLSEFSGIYCDPSMFHRQADGSESIADQMKPHMGKYGYLLKPASNDRVGGWARMRDWLSMAPDGLPYWLISERCINLIRTIPAMVRDDNKLEDLDTKGEDHACDSARYQLMHLRWINAKAKIIQAESKPDFIKKASPAYKHNLDISKFK